MVSLGSLGQNPSQLKKMDGGLPLWLTSHLVCTFFVSTFLIREVVSFGPSAGLIPAAKSLGISIPKESKETSFLCSFAPSLCYISRKSLILRGAKVSDGDNDEEPQFTPPFDLAALAGQQPENFVPADFLALHEMILGATAKDKSSASRELTSVGSALAEEMQRAYTNRFSALTLSPCHDFLHEIFLGIPNWVFLLVIWRGPDAAAAARAPSRGRWSTRGSTRSRGRGRRSDGFARRPSAACRTTRPSCRPVPPCPLSLVAGHPDGAMAISGRLLAASGFDKCLLVQTADPQVHGIERPVRRSRCGSAADSAGAGSLDELASAGHGRPSRPGGGLRVRVRVRVCVRACVCVCVRARTRACAYLLCMFERKNERERENESDKEKERVRMRECPIINPECRLARVHWLNKRGCICQPPPPPNPSPLSALVGYTGPPASAVPIPAQFLDFRPNLLPPVIAP